jgi:hypothetical protein
MEDLNYVVWNAREQICLAAFRYTYQAKYYVLTSTDKYDLEVRSKNGDYLYNWETI